VRLLAREKAFRQVIQQLTAAGVIDSGRSRTRATDTLVHRIEMLDQLPVAQT
jgi:hypothetical protein